MSRPAALLANLGAEEGGDWRARHRARPLRAAATLWTLLFARGVVRLDAASPEPWPDWLRAEADRPALDVLEMQGDALVAWLSTPEAAALAEQHGWRLAGAPPEVVARVHDKAFGLEAARELGLLDGQLAACVRVLPPLDAAALTARAECEVAGWPEPWRASFTLKPRMGTSGRGRIRGTQGRLDRAALARLDRAALTHGFVLEPWLERRADVSTQLWIDAAGEVCVLGQTGLEVTPGGRCSAFHELRPGDTFDGLDPTALHALRTAALAVAERAACAGYRGACGVDALSFIDVDGALRLRPLVELNARFGMGWVALGLFARARRQGETAARLVLRADESGGRPLPGGYGLRGREAHDAPARS
jgi:hypothetical protein